MAAIIIGGLMSSTVPDLLILPSTMTAASRDAPTDGAPGRRSRGAPAAWRGGRDAARAWQHLVGWLLTP
jgi:hypothetical protein